jgi:hypothetical protein
MKRVVPLVGLTLLVILVTQTSVAAEPAPTFAKDVAPIIFGKCATCHRPGEVAPMSLLTYSQVRPWAKAIRGKVVTREMPPWGADPRYGKFSNDRSLTQKEIDTIVTWIDGGAPKGNDADMPPPPRYAEGWEHGQPDAVVEMIAPYQLPAEGELPNMYFYAAVPFKEDKYGRLVEFRPGNRSVMHHCNAAVGDLPPGAKIDAGGELVFADGTRENDKAEEVRRTSSVSNLFTNLLDCVPGRSAFPTPSPDVGFKIAAGKYIRFGLHYQASGSPGRIYRRSASGSRTGRPSRSCIASASARR